LSQSIKNELMKVDRSLSPFNEHSVITAVNNNQEVVLDNMFQEVFQKAMTISRETDGAFDITVAPLVNAWGFGFKNGTQPDRRQVDSLREMIGYEKLSLVNGKVQKKDPRMMLDCSAIAKGYGTDMVARLLKERGVQNYMVEIGGEIVTKGVNAQRVPWKIGVTKPDDDSLSVGNELQTILNVTDKAMATSGNYRRFYYKGGKRFAHTIDPKTGYPVQHNILSATVLADDCATADAYATSFMVMGMEGAKRVLERHPELMAYLIYDDGHGKNAVWFSPSLRDKIAK
jgi:thiamine biosynthesis lipoprotein